MDRGGGESFSPSRPGRVVVARFQSSNCPKQAKTQTHPLIPSQNRTQPAHRAAATGRWDGRACMAHGMGDARWRMGYWTGGASDVSSPQADRSFKRYDRSYELPGDGAALAPWCAQLRSRWRPCWDVVAESRHGGDGGSPAGVKSFVEVKLTWNALQTAHSSPQLPLL